MKPVKPTVGPDSQGKSRFPRPWVYGSLFLLGFLGLILVYLARLHGGGQDVNTWTHREGIPATGEVTDAQGAKFQSDFGLGPDLERRFEERLTDGGRARTDETQRRMAAFSAYINRNRDSFNRNPAEAVRGALEDPSAFGLKAFPADSKKTLVPSPKKP